MGMRICDETMKRVNLMIWLREFTVLFLNILFLNEVNWEGRTLIGQNSDDSIWTDKLLIVLERSEEMWRMDW